MLKINSDNGMHSRCVVTFPLQMLLSKIEGTTPRLLDLTTVPEFNETGMINIQLSAIVVV